MIGELPRGSFHGVRVLDLSRWIAGPFATMLMADAGADVIKVEGLRGEDARRTPPMLGGTSAYIQHYNRNKRAVAMDLRAPRCQELLRGLVLDWADIVVENFRPGVMERMGLGYEQLSKDKPELIVTSVSGYGDTGSYSERPCFNAIAEGFSGAMSLTGEADAPPMMSGYFAADHGTGLYATIGTLLAWVERQRSGVGQRVELALTDAMFSLLGYAATAHLNGLDFPDRTGNRDNATAPADLFTTADGQPVYIDAGTDGMFATLCGVMGRPDLATDPRFASNEQRLARLPELHDQITAWAENCTWQQLREDLEEAGIPFGPVNTVAQAIEEPQYKARGMVAEVISAGEQILVPGMVLNFSKTPGSIRSAAPLVGEHTRQVLIELCGLSGGEVAELVASRLVSGR